MTWWCSPPSYSIHMSDVNLHSTPSRSFYKMDIFPSDSFNKKRIKKQKKELNVLDNKNYKKPRLNKRLGNKKLSKYKNPQLKKIRYIKQPR